jgi:uncharacterized protein YjcR
VSDKQKRVERCRKQRERKQKRKRKKTPVAAQQWLRNIELAALLGISPMTVHRWKQLAGFPPASVVNGVERRHIEQINKWMEQQKAAPHSRRPWLLESRRQRQTSETENVESAA